MSKERFTTKEELFSQFKDRVLRRYANMKLAEYELIQELSEEGDQIIESLQKTKIENIERFIPENHKTERPSWLEDTHEYNNENGNRLPTPVNNRLENFEHSQIDPEAWLKECVKEGTAILVYEANGHKD